MYLVQINHNGDGTEDESNAQLLSSEPTGICDAFGNTKVLPQIRDQYQVDFLTLSKKSDYLWLTIPN